MSSVFCFHWSTPSGSCSGKFLKSRILCNGCRMLCLTFIIACSALNAVSIPSLSIACHASLDCSCTAHRTTCICIRTVSLTGLLSVVLRLAGRLFFANLWLCRSPSNLWSLEPCPCRATFRRNRSRPPLLLVQLFMPNPVARSSSPLFQNSLRL